MHSVNLVDKWEDAEAYASFQQHLERIQRVKPTITKDLYKTIPYPKHSERLIHRSEKFRIERDNRALGERLCKIKLHKGEFGKLFENNARRKLQTSSGKTRYQVLAELGQKEVQEENLKFLQRLVDAKPFCSRSQWKSDRKIVEKFLKRRRRQRIVPLRFQTKLQREKAFAKRAKGRKAVLQKIKADRQASQRFEAEESKRPEGEISTGEEAIPPKVENFVPRRKKSSRKKKKSSAKPRHVKEKIKKLDKSLKKAIKNTREKKRPRPPVGETPPLKPSVRAKRIVKPAKKTVVLPLRERVAARKIQSGLQDALARKRVEKERAAKMIQKSVRKQHHQKTEAAVKIQYRVRKRRKSKSSAVIKIQSSVRQRIAKAKVTAVKDKAKKETRLLKSLEEDLNQKKEQDAATKIQEKVRQRNQRKAKRDECTEISRQISRESIDKVVASVGQTKERQDQIVQFARVWWENLQKNL